MLKGIHLTLLIGPGVPVPVPRDVLEALTSVKVTTSTAGPSGFELTFNLSNRSPLHTLFLVAGGALPPIMRVIVIVTMHGQTEVLIDGVMTKHQVTPQGEGGMATLTVTGEDLTKIMDFFEVDGFPFPAMGSFVSVAAIIGKYAGFGLIPIVVPPFLNDVEPPLERISIQRGTDLNYLCLLANAVGHVFYLEAGPVPGTSKAYWGPEVKVGVPQPALNLDMDSHRNVESLNFSFNSQEHVQTVVHVTVPLLKTPLPIPVPEISVLNPPLGLIPVPASRTVKLPDASKLTPTKALLRALTRVSKSADQITARGSLDVVRYGRLLKARRLVGVRGAGYAFDGLYYVQSVTHHLKRGEYKQDFELSRNGLVSTLPKVPA